LNDEYTRKVVIGMAGAICGVVTVAIVGVLWPRFVPLVTLPENDPASRIAFAIRWLIVPGLTLLIGICAAARRGFFPDAIDGTRAPANRALEINLRYNQNTLEQVVLVIVAWPALAVVAPDGLLAYLPVMAGLFGIGRICFWIGYAIRPVARAFGMVLTVLPTLVAYVWLLSRAWTALPGR
jgi:hypothetical protein